MEAGWAVIGLSRRPGNGDGQPHYEAVAADAADAAVCEPLVAKVDAVVFNAAHIPADLGSPTEATACLQTNALLPLAYLGWLSARPRPFIYISGGQGYQTGQTPALETAPFFPTAQATFYLGSKLLGDIYTEHYRLAHQHPTAVLRAGSLYGPGQQRGMVARFVTQAKAGGSIVLQDRGTHRADLTFVADVGQAVVGVLERRAVGIFNVGSGRSTSAAEAAVIILRAAGRRPEDLSIQPATGEPKGFAPLDIGRARAHLGFEPTPPETGLALTVDAWR